LQERFNEQNTTRIAAFFLELFHAAERQARPPDGFRAIESTLQVFINLLLEVKLQLVIQLALHRPPANKSTQAMQKVAQHACASLIRSAAPRWDPLSPRAKPESSWPEWQQRPEESKRRRTSRDPTA
jgi:hypothetical protein